MSPVLLAAMLVLWCQSYVSPWQTMVSLNHIGAQGGLIESNWAWNVRSSDGAFDVEPRYSFLEWRIPYWKLTALCAVLPVRWLVRAAGRKRTASGCCRRCGYDLRATPERCPECGTRVTPPATLQSNDIP